MRRCRHDIMRDIIETIRDFDEGEGIPPSRMLFGKSSGSFTYKALYPHLDKLCDTGMIERRPGVMVRSKRYKLLPKGTLWLSSFNQLEEMIEGGE